MLILLAVSADSIGLGPNLQNILKICPKIIVNVAMVSGTEPAWIDVLTDLLLSLLSQPQNMARVIVNLSFIQLIPHFTTTSLRLITDVSQSHCSAPHHHRSDVANIHFILSHFRSTQPSILLG